MALLDGNSSGQRWLRSSWRLVSASGVPPEAETRNSADPVSGVKTILSSDPHTAPRPFEEVSHTVTTLPLSTATFFSFLSVKNAIHLPSGEKNGVPAPSVPGMGLESRASTERRYSCSVSPDFKIAAI